MPIPKDFSTFLLRLDSDIEIIQNRNATTQSASNCLPKNSGSCSGIILPTCNRSVKASMNTNEVSLKTPINVLI